MDEGSLVKFDEKAAERNIGTRVLFLSFLAVAFILPVWIRTLFESYRAVVAAEEYLSEGNHRSAIASYGEALSWDSPLNFWASSAESRLLDEVAREKGDPQAQIAAREILLQAKMVTRNALMPRNEGLLKSLRDEIGQLRTREENFQSPAREVFRSERKVSFQMLSQFGFWLFLVGILTAIWRGFSREGVCVRSAVRKYALIAFIGYGIWAVGLVLS
ncbi:MAG: hypothetical protein KDD64_00040 [Bdellovibrionales bacterium]|nr:hypothetical protein [Bdellovibrionales bacterium]